MELKDRIQAMPQMLAAAQVTVKTDSAEISDKDAKSMPLLFPEFEDLIGTTVKKDFILRYEGDLYRVGQPTLEITETYLPGTVGTESLYSKIEFGEGGYEVWKEWDGISGVYKQDQVVIDPFDGNNLYISKIPNNVWGPPHEQPDYWDPYIE